MFLLLSLSSLPWRILLASPRGAQQSTGETHALASMRCAVDLKLLSILRRVRHRSFKSKTALES
jgi:hypothetical protein